jgi:Mlc titration factor MtfA (ptsG expression regulator)
MFGWLRERRRARIVAEPFPRSWDVIIDDNVVLARGLDPARRARLRDLVQMFIAEKYWEGCGGLELTEEIQVTIAAHACLLVLNRNDDAALYDDVASILVYPGTLLVPPRPLGTFEQPRAPIGHGETVIGQAMLGGPVVIAWDAALAGGRGETPGNVVLHEFAHKLDMATGKIDGTPPLATKADRKRWARVCEASFLRHRGRVDAGWPTLLDAYGATNEAEFFAVATETYFTRPLDLAYEHQDVYALLDDFYRGR